jgi:hypothetical protein
VTDRGATGDAAGAVLSHCCLSPAATMMLEPDMLSAPIA